MDLTTISTAFSSLKAATDIVKIIKESNFSLDKAETQMKLAELISALAETKIQVAEVQQLLMDKDCQILKLQEKLSLELKVHWEKPYYWLNEGAEKEGPFCQQCYDNDKRLIRLQGENGRWNCKTCKCVFYDASYERSRPAVVSRSSFIGNWRA